MSATSKTLSRLRVMRLFLVVMPSLWACSTWEPISIETLGPEPHPSSVRVYRGPLYESLHDVHVFADTLLVGVTRTGTTVWVESISLDQVTNIEQSKGVDLGKTVLAVGGGAVIAAAAVTVYPAVAVVCDDDPFDCDRAPPPRKKSTAETVWDLARADWAPRRDTTPPPPPLFVGGWVSAPGDNPDHRVMVELFDAPDRVLHRERVRVNGSYRINYPRGLMHCETLAVRFTTPDGLTHLGELGSCGQHVVDLDILPGE